MIVLGRANSLNVRKVMWCAAELNLPISREDFGRGFAPVNTDAFKALNPNAKVPVLRDGDVVLWESNTICRYLSARYGPLEMLPADPAGRAHVEKWMDWQVASVQPPMHVIFHGQVVSPGSHTDEEMAAAADELHGVMAILDASLASRPFVAGDHLSAADFAVGAAVNRYMVLDIDRPALVSLHAYYERLCGRPAFAEHVRLPTP